VQKLHGAFVKSLPQREARLVSPHMLARELFIESGAAFELQIVVWLRRQRYCKT